jgi:hypothetical protein
MMHSDEVLKSYFTAQTWFYASKFLFYGRTRTQPIYREAVLTFPTNRKITLSLNALHIGLVDGLLMMDDKIYQLAGRKSHYVYVGGISTSLEELKDDMCSVTVRLQYAFSYTPL